MTRDRSLDIAVTGVFARLPGSSDVADWWASVKAGRVLTKRYERHELLDGGVPADLLDDPAFVPVHGHLPDAERFDNALFRVSPREAELMDPQLRLMLEAVWRAFEDAGVNPRDVTPRTGVYASASGSGYLRSMVRGGALDPLALEEAVHGTEPDFLAGLISYKFDLDGPAMAVQTACSSSLVAVHLACQALLNGDCDQAVVVAAGVAFPQAGHLAVPGGIHSPSGHCRPFDENADGVVAGSGVTCAVLRRLTDVPQEGPEPYGVVLGTAVNNDGAAKAGYYAPSVGGQEAVIRSALLAADVEADTVGYLETHGTGTRLGDPIEWSAASSALAAGGARPGQVAVGALKANIGHVDNAAGLAALIKALLVVREGVIPPVAGFTRVNPLLEPDASPLYIPRTEGPWTGPEPRRAGVSSFGIGGTNAHVVVEQPEPTSVARPRTPQAGRLALLSAADSDALERSAGQLSRHLVDYAPELIDVSRTLASARAELPERLAVSGRTAAEVAHRLSTGEGWVRGTCPTTGPAPVVLAFPGQGAQYPGMAIPFADALPRFSCALDDCLDAFGPALATRVRRALLDVRFAEDELAETELAQPALFAVEYAVARSLSELGPTPSAVIGHSLGEVTAACIAGILDLADAARFVTVRGMAMQQCPPGAMLALGCDVEQAHTFVAASGHKLETAAVNSPESCVLAGAAETVEAFDVWLDGRIFTRRLSSRRAFHSALIDPALPYLAEAAAHLVVSPPELPVASNVTGRLIPAGAKVSRGMFAEQARSTVQFASGLAEIVSKFPDAVVVEVGPGRALTAMAEAIDATAVPMCPARTERRDEEVLTALGSLWTQGQPLDLAHLNGGGRRIRLPGYPFGGPRWIAPETVPTRSERGPREEPSSRPPTTADTADCLAEPSPVVDPSALVMGLWAELLGIDALGYDADFFELGGDSLLITRLARKANTELGVAVPVRELLAARTLGRQIEIVRKLVS